MHRVLNSVMVGLALYAVVVPGIWFAFRERDGPPDAPAAATMPRLASPEPVAPAAPSGPPPQEEAPEEEPEPGPEPSEEHELVHRVLETLSDLLGPR